MVKLDYNKLSDVERCYVVGLAIRNTWFARVYQPDKVEELTEKFRADKLNRIPVARWNQIPRWLWPSEMLDPGEDASEIRTQVFMGGRGSGKSSTASYDMASDALMRPAFRGGILGPTFSVSVGVGMFEESGIQTIIKKIDPTLIKNWNDVKKVLTLINGSTIECYSSDAPKSIEGHQFHRYWVDEVVEVIGQGGSDCVYRKRIEPGVRLLGAGGEPIRKTITGTPGASPLVRDLHDSWQESPDEYAWTQLATRDNEANLDSGMVRQLYKRAEKDPYFKRTALEGNLILESPRALLTMADIEAIRITDPRDPRHRDVSECRRLEMFVDSNHSEDKKSDLCGIIVAGLCKHPDRKRMHVFADASTPEGPHGWGLRIIAVLKAYPEIKTVWYEDDKSMVGIVIGKVLTEHMQELGRVVKCKPMHHGNRSKLKRADPASVEYKLEHVLHDPCHRVREWADLSELEYQWTAWDPALSGPKAKSPDRLDAAVYGVERNLLGDIRQTTYWSASDLS